MNRPRPMLTLPSRRRALAAAALAALLGSADVATATPTAGAYLVFDARSGEVVARHNADQAWYPASVTKLMTTWVTLQAIRSGRIRTTSPVIMTAAASRQPPSKMGFKVGEVVTVDNALKIIMVKSANDVSWALAEAVGGSKEAFVAEMNRQARLLGMRSTRWGNPHGLPDASQVTTARDLGLLARALLAEFPEAARLWRLPGIQIGEEIIRNHNHLLDRFPGADGMKTGFICSSGFNVVASARRGDRKLVAVVLGARNTRQRAELAAELFTKGFDDGGGLFGRFSARETLDHMARGPEAGQPVRDMKPEICGKKRDNTPDPEEIGEARQMSGSRDQSAVIRPGELGWTPAKPASYLTERFDIGPPVRVWVGGADAAPGDAGEMLALAPTNDPAALMHAPTFATAAAPPPGAIRPPVSSGPPADGAPLKITAPGALAPPPTAPGRPVATRTAAKPPAAAPVPAKKPAAATTAVKPTAKAASTPVPMPAAKPKPKPGA
ncbi:MAG: D-alanyl-D-alanine carboxypeptidase [Siculibacillus sp.]|nr:D-alanyl-D-alanine carboxypeptidase [Siculibacillus sp.]